MGLSAVDLEFSQCIDSIEVTDCSFNGPLFTWSKKQVTGYIAKKLDRTFVNMDFITAFPSAHTEFISPGFSDHCASVTQFRVSSTGVPCQFRFFNFLTKNCNFLSAVAEAWNSGSLYGCKQFILSKKLMLLKPALRNLNRDCYSNIHVRL